MQIRFVDDPPPGAVDQDRSGWEVLRVTNMSEMFANASSFNQSLIGWNVSSVTDMRAMFAGAVAFNQSLDGWNVSGVSDMSGMFATAIIGTAIWIANRNSINLIAFIYFTFSVFSSPLIVSLIPP